MSALDSFIPRDLLAEAFGGNPRLVRAFEDQAIVVAETEKKATATAEATTAIEDAVVITLSPNAAFTNERILTAGSGIAVEDDGERAVIRIDETVPKIEGARGVTFYVTAATALKLPRTGTLATLAGEEQLRSKTLVTPLISTFGNHADDTAAASAGVPVGGIYRTGSALKVRVA